MKKFVRSFLVLLILCSCSGFTGNSEGTGKLPTDIRGDFPARLVDGSTETLVCVARERNAHSLKSHLKDRYIVHVYDVESGKQRVEQELSVNGNPFQAVQAWAYGEGALLYGYSQEQPGKKNRNYSLLLVNHEKTELISLGEALHPVFFDEKSGLLGWADVSATEPTISFLSITDRKPRPDRKVKENFFHTEANGDGAVYLFSAHSEKLSVSRYTLPLWNESWKADIPLRWKAHSTAKQIGDIMCIHGEDSTVGLDAKNGTQTQFPYPFENIIATIGEKYVVQKDENGLIIKPIR